VIVLLRCAQNDETRKRLLWSFQKGNSSLFFFI
jgi:hypothetical protein